METIKVAITGKTGKSTVASLIYAALSQHTDRLLVVSRDGTMIIDEASERIDEMKNQLNIVIVDDDGWIESNGAQ